MVRPPTIADGTAYFCDRAGGVYAVDAMTGELTWEYRYQATANEEVVGPPVVADDLVLVDVDEGLSSHDRATGTTQWRIDAVGANLTMAAGLLVADRRDVVQAWDLTSQQRRWHAPEIAGLLSCRPTEAGGLLIYAQTYEPNHVHGGLHALDRATGHVAWSVDADEHECCLGDKCDDQVMPSPFPVATAGDLVWTTRMHDHSMGDLAYDLVGLDARTGRELAAHPLSWLDTGEYVSGAVAVADGYTYCPAGARIAAVELSTGTVRWTHRCDAEIVGAPVAGELLHIATADGQVHGLEVATGTPRWSVSVGEVSTWVDALDNAAYEYVPTPLVLTGRMLCVATDAGVLGLLLE